MADRSGPFVVCVPMKVDAFILNQPVCESGSSRIAPITQPEHRGLRPDNREIKADILPHVDVSSSQPASSNSRISVVENVAPSTIDPTRPETDREVPSTLRNNRIGVYVHWSLPRLYRTGTSGADGSNNNNRRSVKENNTPQPTFRRVPNRWYVMRRIKSSIPPAPGPERTKAWVVESDRLWNVEDLGSEVDLESDVSPYVSFELGDENKPDTLNKQASVYIGAKYPALTWVEQPNPVPRVPLTIMNSSNFCFADNAVHNPNVFSIIDNFEYQALGNVTVRPQSVTCDYTVLGWHSDPLTDPIGRGNTEYSYGEIFHTLFLSHPNPTDGKFGCSTVCHGTIYNVQYNRDLKPPTPADKYGDLFTQNTKMEPLSIGATTLDSILAFLEAHESNSEEVFGQNSASVASNLLNLSQLLYATENDYDSRIRASDKILEQNFEQSEGGRTWVFDGKAKPGEPPARPSTIPEFSQFSELDLLREAGSLEHQLATARRKLKYTKWLLFTVWWSFVSDVQNDVTTHQTIYRDLLVKYRDRVKALVKLISDPNWGLEGSISRLVIKGLVNGQDAPPLVKARIVPQSPFLQRKDPSLGIAGIDSGWSAAYVGYVQVRLLAELPEVGGGKLFENQIKDSYIPEALWSLRKEALSPQQNNQIGFGKWDGQPWCPLYVEWEATYFHIPIDKWSVAMLSSPLDTKYFQVRYQVKDNLETDLESASDQRTVNGRIILHPQSSVDLRALVDQVVTHPGVTLSDQEIVELKSSISNLKFISADLSGITTNLLTLAEGAHVQPNVDVPGIVESMPLLAALNAATAIGFTQDDLKLIGEESALTPFGNILDFSGATKQPFKGVTHGQMRFTKLNVIDKFGQVISAIPPGPISKTDVFQRPTAYPCLSDQFSPNLIPGTSNLNTVTPLTQRDPQLPSDYPLCPYIQLTPAINQDARLNATFLVPKTGLGSDFTGWRASDDWDLPAFAWVVVNYANYGLQFFTGEGLFYVEISLGGPSQTIKRPNWQPFEPPSQESTNISPQLLQLMDQLTHPTTGSSYLQGFWQMITSSIESMPFAPADYMAYSTSIVGKPFALVNAGFSLELSLPPFESQITPPPIGVPLADDLLAYKFPIKIGDKDRPFDGVVGYFDTANSTSGATNWERINTEFPIKGELVTGDPRVEIRVENLDTLSPYYIDPQEDGSFADRHAAKYMVKTMLIDPFAAAHVFSPILPVKSIKLPPWVIQSAFRKMTAFFRLGPILITKDVPKAYDASKAVAADSWLQKQQAVVKPEAAEMKLPVGGAKGQIWNWLQPYSVDGEKRYNALDVGEEDGKLRLDKGPYTMVEGYLQLMQPFSSEESR